MCSTFGWGDAACMAVQTVKQPLARCTAGLTASETAVGNVSVLLAFGCDLDSRSGDNPHAP
jgi:hypothetical protein